MKYEDFKKGQRIHFAGFYGNDSILGTITKVEEGFVYFTWDKRAESKTSSAGRFRQQSSFDRISLVSAEEEFKLKRHKVDSRIKKLWNNSNWVKNNPAQAY